MSTQQMTLELEPGMLERYSNLLEVLAAGVYGRGLKRVAMDLDKAPGNLSRELAGDSDRHFSVESLERYIQTQGDLTPIYWLIVRYMGEQARAEAATLKRVESWLTEVASLVGQAGVKPKARRA